MPLYKLTVGQPYRLDTRAGERVNAVYAGWLRLPDGTITHRFDRGRARRELPDRTILAVTKCLALRLILCFLGG